MNYCLTIAPRMMLAVACLLMFALPVFAGKRPNFYLNRSLEHATDVLLVDEGEVIDGRVVVRQVWRGESKVGDTLELPDLAVMAEPEMRTTGPWWDSEDRAPIVGKHLIVFLCRDAARPDRWEASSYPARFGLRYAAVWVEGVDVFAFMQIINPGPTRLIRLMERPLLEAKIVAHNLINDERSAAVTAGDAERLLAVAKSFRGMDFHISALNSVQALSGLGEAGADQLRVILQDPTSLSWHETALEALVQSQTPGVEADLVAAVRRGHDYFQQYLPRLEPGWWNDMSNPRTNAHRNEYGRMIKALWLLDTVEHGQTPEVVQQLATLWQEHETVTQGLEQVHEACLRLGGK